MPDLQLDTAPDPADMQFLEDRLNEFNIAVTGIPFGGPIACFIRSAAGEIEAGISGFIWGGCLVIQHLWVDVSRRKQGLGSRLLAAAEREGAARGCHQVVLETHSFQAPEFYNKLGYQVVGTLNDYPTGGAKYQLRKRLGSVDCPAAVT
jgi:ribosomal protein S18 acetylase RimI-like enzyme